MKKREYISLSKWLNDDMLEVFSGFQKDYCFPTINWLYYEEFVMIIIVALEFLMCMNCFDKHHSDSCVTVSRSVHETVLNTFSLCDAWFFVLINLNFMWLSTFKLNITAGMYAYDLTWEMCTWDILLAWVRLLK